MMTDKEYYDDDAKYEAALRDRTPQEWEALSIKAKQAEVDVIALRHLMSQHNVKELESIQKIAANPDKTLGDVDYCLRQFIDLADHLRNARDNPHKHEVERWQKLLLSAAMVGTGKARGAWLQNARDLFPPPRPDDRQPDDCTPLLAHATYAVVTLLDSLLLDPEQSADLERHMSGKFLQWAGENGIRSGVFKANGELELLGAVIPFKPHKAPEEPAPY
jgi:hypothetical protein